VGWINAAQVTQSGQAPPAVETIIEWIKQDIAKPNRELGRPGAVCPFVPPALQSHCIWISVVDDDISDADQMKGLLSACLSAYDQHDAHIGASSGLRTFIVVFPRLTRPDRGTLIDEVHGMIKPVVVERGLMLGEFYPESTSAGVHNPTFLPLRSPMPLFVLRQMVPADLVFLNKKSDRPERRAQYLRAYLRRFDGELSEERRAETRRALAAADTELLSGWTEVRGSGLV
jgi:hypothetical protein